MWLSSSQFVELRALHQNLSPADRGPAERACLALECAFHQLDEQQAQKEVEISDLLQRVVSTGGGDAVITTAQASRFSSIPSEYQLSYGSA